MSNVKRDVEPSLIADDPPDYSSAIKEDPTFSFERLGLSDDKGAGKTSKLFLAQPYDNCTRCKGSIDASVGHYGCQKCIDGIVCICQKCRDEIPTCQIHYRLLIKRTLKSWSSYPAYVDYVSPCPTKDDNPLIHALKSQNHDLLLFHARDPDLINAHTYLGYTPLHFAAHLGLVSGASTLLQNGALTNSRDENNMSPLIVAISLDHSEVVNLLLQNGANIHSVCGARETTALHAAADSGFPHFVSLLLEKGAIIDLPSGRGTALQLACLVNSLESASILLERGSNPNARSVAANPPVMYAVSYENSELLNLLIKYGADVDLPSLGGKYKNRPALAYAVCIKSPDMARILIKRGANVNWAGEFGFTNLMNAARWNQLEICRLLIEAGADLDAEMVEGKNAVFYAAYYGREDILDLLLRGGASATPPTGLRGKWKKLETYWGYSLKHEVSKEARKRIMKRLKDAEQGK